ncbi:signal peptidase II [Rhodovulum sp. DZ06]|uniref:signal peptidase II n=1 Tax=Rhodovulum sp. DZ06 TaxID=3425126 RepID=UPI003D343AF7
MSTKGNSGADRGAPGAAPEQGRARRAAGRLKIVAWVALAAFLLDRASKYWVVELMDLATQLRIDVAPPYLTLLMAWNEGANFGLGDDLGRGFWILLALAISSGLTIWALRLASPWRRICIGLLVGGALGNALDRWIYGAVADFLNMSCCGFYNPYAFNPADIFIFAGAIGLVALGAEPPAAEAEAKAGTVDGKDSAGKD